MKVVFWNTKRDLTKQLVEIAANLSPDIIITCDDPAQPAHQLRQLNKSRHNGMFGYRTGLSFPNRIKVFSLLGDRFIQLVGDGKRFVVLKYSLPTVPPFLLMGIHARSKRETSRASEDQAVLAQVIVTELAKIQETQKLSRTLIVGDFNMSPFETGMVASNCFHSVSDRNIVAENTRKVDGLETGRMYYNPMWNLLGDQTNGPPATYYYRQSSPAEYFWYMFDQVLLSSDWVGGFVPGSLKILESTGETSLVNRNGRPNKTKLSDHLPIMFEVNHG